MGYIQHKAEESLEDYLETIMLLRRDNPSLHAVDIARELDYSKPSVSVALKNMREKGFVDVSADGVVTLTEAGEEKAKRVYERHELLSRWLESIGVPKTTAEEDACRMEHDMSEVSFAAIKKFLTENTGKQ